MATTTQTEYPLQRSYAASLIVAVLALAPYVVVSTAAALYQNEVGRAIGASRTDLQIVMRLSEAGYAFGALLGGDLAQRFAQRPLFLLVEGGFFIGAVLAAAAPSTYVYGIGIVLLGFTTGLQLIVALPPLFQRFPPERVPISAAAINIGFFGAVSAGPLIGSFVAAEHAWRWFHGGLAAVAFGVLALATATLPDQNPPNPGLRFDRWAIALALAATVLPFWATGELTAHGFAALWFWLPLWVGLACFVALLLTEYHKENPLAPIERMWTTFPVIGTLTATAAGGVATTLIALGILLQRSGRQPLPAIGMAFAPQIVGTLIGAALLGVLLRTRGLPLLVLFGMVALLGAGALLAGAVPTTPGTAMLAATGLLGLGAGATVSPGLYLAGFSLPSKSLGRIFALVELIRSVGDYVLAPVMSEIARLASGGGEPTSTGIVYAIWITVAITAGSTLVGVAIYLTGTTRLPQPDLARWLKENREAVTSPRLAARLRGD